MAGQIWSLGRRAVLGGLAAALMATPALAQRAEPCIGASWEMTGPLANNGGMLRVAVETALEEINAAGGVLGKPLKLVIYDDVGEPARAVDNGRRIGERDNCVIMMGGGRTPNAIALREPLAEMGLPWIGPISAGTTVIEHQNGQNEWMFRVSMKDRWVGGYLVDQARQRSRVRQDRLRLRGHRLGPGRPAGCRGRRPPRQHHPGRQGDLQHRRPGHVGADDPAARCRRRYRHPLGGGPRERQHAALDGPHRLQAEDRLRLGPDHGLRHRGRSPGARV